MSEETLVVTALLDPVAEPHFAALRQRYFPPVRNIVPAHISLFHKLPASELPRLTGWLQDRLRNESPFAAHTSGVRFLGRGVAYQVECTDLLELRAAMAAEWHDFLTPQDAQKYQPHITIQNKADPAAARQLFEQLQADFRPDDFSIVGIRLWHYRDGPWEEAASMYCRAT